MREYSLPILISALLLLGLCTSAVADDFGSGNLLVTGSVGVREYSLDGSLVQSLLVPYPNGRTRDVEGLAMGDDGRVHIYNTTPFAPSYISTYTPQTDSWNHTRVDFFSGVSSNNDLGIFEDTLYTWSQAISVGDFSVTDIEFTTRHPGEIVAGKDGFLYALYGGSITELRRFPRDFISPIELTATIRLQDSTGRDINTRGAVVEENGDIFCIANGRIFHFDKTGSYIKEVDVALRNPSTIARSSEGVIAVGGTREVALFDSNFTLLNTIDVFDNTLIFVEFAPVIPVTVLGDVNQNGVVNFSDIPTFIATLQAGTFLEQADCNQDGEVTFADIPAFIRILQG